ncbi:MAG: DUF2711 family protein [Paracoccus sp. (in: a-proteobacteria)]|nr:DUF2711 family protein [Paracoccus sp. (in: a-proteobacteria)]
MTTGPILLPCPNDGPVMDAYAGHFERVEVVLHPFLAPNRIPLARFNRDDYPSDAEVLADCRPVAWRDLIGPQGMASLSRIDIALRSMFGALRNPDRALQDQLQEMMDRLVLIPPDAGLLSPHVERAFLNWMADTGHDIMRVSDEFNFTATDLPITEMIGQTRVPAHGMIAAMDGSALLVTHWDSCCSFLCRNGDARPVPGLESFPCTKRTDVFWGLHPL